MLSRLAVLLYGVVSYLLFFATFTYAILFIGGILVPRTIDAGGPRSDLLPAILIDVGLLALFGVQHTIMARRGFKTWWTRFIPESIERSTFVLATCVCFLLLFLQWRPIDAVIWEVTSSAGRIALWSMFAGGMGVVLISSFMIDHFELFGLRQTVEAFLQREPKRAEFQLRFFYKYVRHPLMLGFVIAFWSAPTMTGGHLLFAVVSTVYIIVALRIEEATLVKIHGDDYRAYQRTVPMIFPRPWRTPQV